MKKTFDKPLDGQKQPANGKNDTAYIYGTGKECTL